MPSLHKDGATFLAERLVLTHVWTPNPRASGIAPMLILKDPIDHKNFLSAIMPMRIEIGLRCPSH
jgi:hypothetical protein